MKSWWRIFSRSHRHRHDGRPGESRRTEPYPTQRLRKEQAQPFPSFQPKNTFALASLDTSTEFFPSIASPPSRPSTSSHPPSPRSFHSFSSMSSSGTGSSTSITSRNSGSSSHPPVSRPRSLFSVPTSSASTPILSPEPDCPLVLTLTSKYPTGTAADLYVPIDVRVPARHSTARAFSAKMRPPSMNLSVTSLHFDVPRPTNVLQRRMTRARRDSLSEANIFYY